MALCQGATSDEVPAVQSLYFLVRFNGKYTALCIYKQFGTCSGNGQTGFTYSSEPTGHGLSFVIACVQDMCIVIWGSCQDKETQTPPLSMLLKTLAQKEVGVWFGHIVFCMCSSVAKCLWSLEVPVEPKKDDVLKDCLTPISCFC